VVALPYLDGASYRRGTLMAAIAHGCAIVTTTPAVPVPAFVDGINMRLVPPNDTTGLTKKLHELYAQPALRDRLRAGTTALQPTFDWAQIAHETAQFFETLI
jgi:glycosyltransferase involved in cell wall biosynthesis